VYHRIGRPARGSSDPFGQAVSPERFEEHLDALRGRFPVTGLGELLAGRAPDRAVAVTFDDGYADNLTEAAPRAARHAVPLAVFVAVEPILEDGFFWWDELAARAGGEAALARLHAGWKQLSSGARRRAHAALRALGDGRPGPVALDTRQGDPGRPLTPAELRELAALPEVTVGAHTLSHPSLAALPAGEQLREMLGSRARLEEHLGRTVDLLAYPFGKEGDVSAETRRLADRAGFRAAFTTEPDRVVRSTDRFALPRLTVHEVPAPDLLRRVEALLG
jgi:peptidoglycan/xylan/chitin deacetylase (PgdA/CDA1 family)